MSLLDLPVEIRLNVYEHLFGSAVVQCNREDRTSLCAGFDTQQSSHTTRSAQILRVCKTILHEARPLLYTRTIFSTASSAFAGRLPTRLGEHAFLKHARTLQWFLRCDLLMNIDNDDLQFDAHQLHNVNSLRLCVEAETWNQAACNGVCSSGSYRQNRDRFLEYGRHLHAAMGGDRAGVIMSEDQTYLRRGQSILELKRNRVPDQSERTDVRVMVTTGSDHATDESRCAARQK